MMLKRLRVFTVFFVVVALVLAVLPFVANPAIASQANRTVYEVKATNGTLTRKVMGEVTSDVNGVPAEPVHSFVWDGEGIEPIRGSVKLEIDPVSNTGKIVAKWTDRNGKWRYEQTAFSPPDHASGVKMGPGLGQTEFIYGDPVTTNVYLHGDTTAGGPVLPMVFNLLATWGPAKVTLNGEPFNNPYDGPAPLWVGHTMTTVGVRNEDGQVFAADGSSIFSPMTPGDGLVDPQDLEFHLVFHDISGPMTSNFPPPLSFFYHLTFEDVEIEITHAD